MKITAIKAQVKNPERVSVYVDEKYAFSLNHAQLLDLKLRVGIELDDASLIGLKKASEFGKAYERSLMYAMLRPRSIKELHDYCRRKKWAPEDCRAIVDKLVAKGYVDDRVFTRAWVENRSLGRKTSLRKLRLELKQKGVADHLVVDVLRDTGFSEQAALAELVAKKRKTARYANDDQKLMQYLARQGFDFDDIKQAIGYP